MAVLNSSAAQFVYSKLFGSVKVLRSHLEQIPIPIADDRKQKEIIAYVEKIIKAKKPQKEIEKTLDKKISELYGLTGDEYQMIKVSLK